MFETAKYREPARLFGNIVAGLAVLLGGVSVLVTTFSDVIPGKYHGQAVAVAGAVAGAAALLAKVQAFLTRNNVWSPEHKDEAEMNATSAAAVAPVAAGVNVTNTGELATSGPFVPVTAEHFGKPTL